MVINIEGFIAVYSRISDDFRINQDKFFVYWNAIPWHMPILNGLSREPYIYTKKSTDMMRSEKTLLRKALSKR